MRSGPSVAPVLVERGVQAVHPAPPERAGGVREHRLHRRLPERAADALEDQERGGRLPTPRQRHRGDREEVDRVAHERHGPVAPGPVGDVPGDRPQRVAEELAEPRDDADGRRGCPERAQERPVDRRPALVGRVREEVDDPHREDEPERRPPRRTAQSIPSVRYAASASSLKHAKTTSSTGPGWASASPTAATATFVAASRG